MLPEIVSHSSQLVDAGALARHGRWTGGATGWMDRALRESPWVPGFAAVVGALLNIGCSTSAAESPQAWADPGDSEEILGYLVMPELELLIATDAVASLEAAPRTYVPADIVFEGVSYGPVGVRLKGQDSFLPLSQKPSLRINVDEYVEGATFFGLKDLTLNSMSTDFSMMHERLAYFVARAADLPASRANHALLTINGEFYGLYMNVETVKKRMIRGWFADATGPLFEATDVDFEATYIDSFDLETGPDDRSLLTGLAEALTIGDPVAAIAAAAAYVDLAHFQRFWAMATIVGQFDAFPYSNPGDDYFLYGDPSSGQLWFIPWGMDETFLSAEFPPLQIHSALARTCSAAPACRQGYVDQVWELLAMTEELGLEAEKLRVEAEIAPHVERDTRKPYTAEDVTEGQTQLGYFIHGRRTILTGSFPPPSM